MKRCFFFAALIIGFHILLTDPKPAFAETIENPFSNNPVMANVDGKPITLDDLKNAQMQELLVQLFRLQKNTLKHKAIGLLLENHPEFKKIPIPKVNQDHIIQFYNSTPGMKESGKLEDLEGRIRGFLDRSFKESYADRIYLKALKEGWVKEYLVQPNDFRLVADLGSAIFWFNKDENQSRKVMLLEYSDFQCPFCKRVQGTLRSLRTRYADEVQFAYRHFPLPFHKEARGLAEAAECARDQGRFWEFQSLVYRKPPSQFGINTLVKVAGESGVKALKQFKDCYNRGKYKDRVTRDLREGSQLGIQATPTFIVGLYNTQKATVNGEMFSGAVREEKFVQMIEKYIGLSKSVPTN